MRVFVTGATGFIGSAVVDELLEAGHEVLGLARSDEGADALNARGIAVHRGDIRDLDSLRRGAAAAEGVIHTAYDHSFTDYAAAAETDRRAIQALGEALVGSGRPLVITAGTGVAPRGVATEETVPESGSLGRVRYENEETAVAFVDRGVRASVVRFPRSVHGRGDHGFVARLIDIARAKGVAGYPGEGLNRWPAVHRLDGAHLFRLALERAPGGSRLHGVGDEGVPVREIAEVIGRHLGLPVRSIPREELEGHFGFLGLFFSLDCPASSTLTQKQMGWRPVQPGLIADMEEGHYFESAGARAGESLRPAPPASRRV